MFGPPRKGNQDDKAHPPIHPVKNADKANFEEDNEWKIYEILARHFLATLSKNATGDQTDVEVKIADEIFYCKGLIVKEKNWLEVFPHEKWNSAKIPAFTAGQQLDKEGAKLKFSTGKTTPPAPLTESDLITLMDKNGIGTDATIHEHIKNVRIRGYVQKKGQFLKATLLGESLVEIYKELGIKLYEPHLRAKMEEDMKAIAEGTKES